MKKHNILLIVTAFILLPLCNGLAEAYPTAKITAKILDESGYVVQGANVHISFEIDKKGGWGTDNFGVNGVSDPGGTFTGEANASERIGITVLKDGYYLSRQLYEFKSTSLLLNRWQPWNPTIEVVLKKIRNPVPMIMGGTGGWVHVPKEEIPIGFDLEKGDWVSPYGHGTDTDFTFTCHAVVRAYADYDVSIDLAFPGSHNGLQEYFFDSKDQSSYKWPFKAPLDGYQPAIHKKVSKQFPGKGLITDIKKEVNYLFRVRSAVNAKGDLVSANYGKITGEIDFDAGNNGGCDFRIGYTFNPDTTRNLEEDPKKNLFKKK